MNRQLLRWLLVAALAVGLVLIVVLADIADVIELPEGIVPSAGSALTRFGYLGGFLLIYIEESGIPLLIPGDVWLIYVGHRLPRYWWAWVGGWAGFVVAVVFGSMNLYLLSRRFGRRLLEHPLARFLHITPERLATAELEFHRWGPWAVIVGRHVPGLRVPLTVAAGILEMALPLFLVCVAISSGVWAAVFLTLGIVYGDSIARLLHSPAVVALPVVALVAIAAWLFRRPLLRLIREPRGTR